MGLNNFNLKNKNFLALLVNVIISGFSVITMSLLFRSFSKTDAGTWFFFLSIQGLVEAIRTGFLNTATIKFYAGAEKERGKSVLGSVWVIAIGITLLVVVISAILYLLIPLINNYQVTIVAKWLGITFISSLPFTVPIWILMAEENYIKILWLRLVNNFSMLIIIAVLIFLNKMTLNNMLILNIATNLLTGLFCIFFKTFHIKTIANSSRKILLELYNFGKFTVSTSTSIMFFRISTTFIITFFLGPIALAVYNLPGRLMTIIEIPLGSSLGTGMSSMATALNKNDEKQFLYIFKKYAGLLTFAIIPIVLGVIIFADLAVYIIGGQKYVGSEAANILRIMIFFSLLFPIDRFNGVALDMLHLPKVNFQKVLLMLGVHIVGSFIGILFFKSLYGIAFFGPFTVISGVLFGYYALKKRINYTIKEIIIIGWQETKDIFFKVYVELKKQF
ncbi:oligosaccharide flippase family protein [Sediminibacterium sp.]|uniref:oligosaccharide flippase family protein n=1 Tax=Sediminibacterium sp. TaxID=1917865 RepID=UPI002733C50D|nr:oligosaccharide flippase family protein [Sediminibacterium sp.]MDP3394736.1 oligosaccharide flippase family protein [Sediminibacterium sp.]MDP3568571.1 oligosaccharide flippase family protein [Sediminibacterium sp.]